ncbi:MAG: hypothetical protein IJA81_03690 [Akkermansia sp.]|nr:hypothetical protein [Akkermansia sp.]
MILAVQVWKYVLDSEISFFRTMKMRQFFCVVSAAAAVLSSCQWAMMESRLADRVDGSSDEYKITGSESLLGGIVEYTAANGKKFYVHRCRVSSERKPGPLFVFGEIDKKHFTVGNHTAMAQALPPVERFVVVGYDDLVFSGITPPAAEYRHPLGEKTMLWRDWETQVELAQDPGLQLVNSQVLPIAPGSDNDHAAWAVYQDAKEEVTPTKCYLLTPLAAVADVPLTILGTLGYLPYYNIKHWIQSIEE